MSFRIQQGQRGRAILAALLTACLLVFASVFGGAAHATPQADGHTITITANEGDHTYGAYQIFKGKLATDGQTLSNLDWGAQVDKGGVLGEIKTIFAGISETSTAADVAGELQKADTATVKKVAEIFAKHVTGTPDTFTKAGTEAPFTYTSVKVEPGYYLVKDTDKNAAALTSPILQVVGDVKVESKSSVPTLTKFVKEDSTQQNGKTADFEIGEDVTFTLTGTLPSNLADFTSYEYSFVDTLSKGFTFKEIVSVTMPSPADGTPDLTFTEGDYTLTKEAAADTSGHYVGGTTFTLAFQDLLATAATKANDFDPSAYAEKSVVVVYTATVNEKAEIKNDGNGNRAKVVYQKSNNKGDGNGNTPDDHTWVFTYKLDSSKVDAKDHSNKLAGAKFRLYNSDKSKSATIENNKITAWVDGDGGTEITTEAGKDFSIEGLDADTYYLRETVAPDGYNLPEGDAAFFKFVITASHEADNQGKGKLTELKIAAGTAAATDGDLASATVKMNIENTKGSALPATGGMGTLVFTVVGVLVMASAGGVLFYRRKNNA